MLFHRIDKNQKKISFDTRRRRRSCGVRRSSRLTDDASQSERGRGEEGIAPLNNNNNGAGRRAVGACSRELGSEERAMPSCTQTRGWNAIYAIMHRRP